jgi:hypothetical protein
MEKLQQQHQKVYFPTDRPHTPLVRNLEELHAVKQLVRSRVKNGEQHLKDRVQELPGQLLYTGFRFVIPPLLSGRITQSALEAGKALIDLFFIKSGGHSAGEDKRNLAQSLKKVGLLSAAKWGFRLLTRVI